MKYIRGIFAFLYMIISTFLVILYALYLHRYPKIKMVSYAIGVPKYWFKPLFLILGIKVKMVIKEKIPPAPVLFFATHRGNLDIPLLSYSLPGGVTYLSKEELFSVPILNIILDTIGSIPIKREDAKNALESLKETAKLLKNNVNVVIFPEGTRTVDGKIGTIKRGGIILAKNSNIPIVPVIIKDGYKIYPKKSVFPNSGTVEIIVEKPIYPEKHSSKELANMIGQIYKSYLGD
ncbi:1-acyl-sn-glycerol-3-phosphate acyltransferase [Thermodesulfobium acidiphilum]|uniref:1-acyl-sn-glycerol-3-phosphate acyltransferase n=1 Tax=Thermodesulfobium acidiphilum TaxID=1794699 RepID=A0A2R4VYW2_THEAF|nr:lysophospholipid acyltransferase family protein [Thermodesulfobium acidiphilum]AWB09733.1 1-acyl-sn-glycerol-3-phosphate acyltransferase [Thermodesulfobium acidiphilum]PMP86322.1 MAG: hypothetical protein C0174_01875 [Thermodesulfobium narugense]